jgi:hypothetical protein
MISQAGSALFAAGVRRVKCAMHHPQTAVALLLTAATQRDGKRVVFLHRGCRQICHRLQTVPYSHGVAAGGQIRGCRRVVDYAKLARTRP